MTNAPVERDERTVAVENAGYRWSYLFLSFGLLVLVAYRSWFRHEQPWDLFALVILGGGIHSVYTGAHRVLSRRWAVVTARTALVAAAAAAALALVIEVLRR